METEVKGQVTNGPTDKTAKVVKLVLMAKDAIKAGQDAIRKNIVSLDMAVHANAVQCLLHAEKHRDTSLFTRLLNDVLDDKTGYNRRGLIRWMHAFSPMELNGKKITLTGLDAAGNKRPFLIDKANATPFYLSLDLNQQAVKPVFQDTLLSKWDTMVREFETAWANTKQEGPKLVAIDPKKPFYNGIHSAQILNFIDKGKAMRQSISDDATREVWLNNQNLKKAEALVASETKAA